MDTQISSIAHNTTGKGASASGVPGCRSPWMKLSKKTILRIRRHPRSEIFIFSLWSASPTCSRYHTIPLTVSSREIHYTNCIAHLAMGIHVRRDGRPFQQGLHQHVFGHQSLHGLGEDRPLVGSELRGEL